jgi:hypothetical protein
VDLITTLLTTTGAGAAYVVARHRHHRARRRALESRLTQLEVGLPLDVNHLSPALGRLAASARLARHRLETPLFRTQQVLGQQLSWWSLRERLDEYDLALADARLAVWEWLVQIARLDGTDVALLRRLSLDPRPLRSLIYAPGVFDRTQDVFEGVLFGSRPDPATVEAALCEAMDMLRQFEVALLSHRPTPYR